jgi:pimeloyl-ACP methyl ester carboxylesterase
MPRANVNGVDTSYEVVGSGASVVLYIHGGFGGASTTLVSRERAVGKIFPRAKVTTVTYDRRSAGQSEYVLTPYQLPDLAADARALLNQLGVDRSVVIGDSMGGMVALEYALAYPEHVTALGLVETGAGLMAETPWGTQMREIVEQAEALGDQAFFESQANEWRSPGSMSNDMGPETPEAQESLAQGHQAYLDALPEVSDADLFTYTMGMIRNFAAFVGYDYGPRLSELRMPVFVIHGTVDVTVPFEYGQALHRGISHSELAVIEGARHMLLDYLEAAAALRDWVLRTVEQTAAAG